MQFSLKEHSAEFLLLTTSIIWGFAFVGIKFSLNEISPENLTILRFFIASFGVLGGVVLLQEKITIALIVGGCLIIFGIVLNNSKQK